MLSVIEIPPIQTLNFLEQHYVCYSVPADFATYHLNNSFKEKLNLSRKNNMQFDLTDLKTLTHLTVFSQKKKKTAEEVSRLNVTFESMNDLFLLLFVTMLY